jgi:uncharacterized membrane protein YjgN (DUF898 family)
MHEGSGPGTSRIYPAPHSRAAFSGDDGEFRRLVTRGTLLELVTFGFYRFWLATNIRRHLWTQTSAGGDALEYTGTGRELLIGFLFALAILVPLYLIYFAIGIEAERAKAFASIPFGLLWYGFWQFAIYRARRYRLTRTLWRGVRFWMTGSGTAYALRAFGWTILTVLTLGLAYPWREAALERYKMGHTFYGDLPGRFEGKAWDFFMRGWWLWLLALTPIEFVFISLWLAEASKIHVPEHGSVTHGVPLFSVRGVVIVVSIIIAPFVYGAFKAIEWKWWSQGLRVGGVGFDCDFARAALIKNIWKMICAGFIVSFLALILFAGIYYAIAGIAPLFTTNGQFNSALSHGLALISAYLAWFLALGVVWRIYMVQRIWKLVVNSISIENLAAADHVVAKGEAANAIGEGLADSLDVAGF